MADETPIITYPNHQNVFVCHRCEAHVVLYQELDRKTVDNGIQYMLFDDLVNVVDNPMIAITCPTFMAQGICCKICGFDLGFQYLVAPKPTDNIKEGKFILYSDKLLLRKDMSLFEAYTEEPFKGRGG